MLKEIGSNFWQNIEKPDNVFTSTDNLQENMKKKLNEELDHISGSDVAFFSLGRAAIEFALIDIAQERAGCKKIDNDGEIRKYIYNVVVPSYVCDTVIDPAIKHNIPITPYDINLDLELTGEQLASVIETNHADVVIFHQYYGFETAPTILPVIEKYRNKGVKFIEDRTQNMFSHFKHLPVDYVVGSFRKWGAIADGGFCAKQVDKFCIDKPIEQDKEAVKNKDRAFRLKYAYMEYNKGNKDDFLKAYRVAENTLNSERHFYRMSDYSMYTFLNHFDVEKVKKIRIANYKTIYELIFENNNINILTKTPNEEDVPLYITFVSDNRDEIQLMLRNQDIYAPIIWPRPSNMMRLSDTVEHIYKSVLSLPIDQRYGKDDMERMAKAINGYRMN